MSESINNPKFNYYEAQKDKIGFKGDFVTAPEISQIFGELIGIWCANVWSILGSPKEFNLVELGPGNGTLITDVLRTLRYVPKFIEYSSIHLIETSETLKQLQSRKLKDYKIFWHKNLSSVPNQTDIIFSNEFLDTFPIHQYDYTETGWTEKFIGVDENKKLCFINKAIPRELLVNIGDIPLNSTIEFSPSMNSYFQIIADRIKENGGCALFIDYGYEKPTYKSTLNAILNHNIVEILDNVGNIDLSAHVDFSQLNVLAKKIGVHNYGIITQSKFLKNLGINQRAEKLIKHNQSQSKNIKKDVNRLIDDNEMGNLFKVYGISQKKISNFPGF